LNQTFVIYDETKGGVPIAVGYGLAWFAAGGDSPVIFWRDLWDGPGYRITDEMNMVSRLPSPAACGKGGCHRAVRWLAPGVVAIDWYRTGGKPAQPIDSDYLMMPLLIENKWLPEHGGH